MRRVHLTIYPLDKSYSIFYRNNIYNFYINLILNIRWNEIIIEIFFLAIVERMRFAKIKHYF